MKKVYGIFTALLLMSSATFADSTPADTNCFDVADSAATAIGGMFNLSYSQEHDVFLAVYDACEENQN